MATARPFTYNPTLTPISGTEQVGDLAIGYPTSGFESTGLQWWNGPDEELGYVICKPIPSNTQPTPIFDSTGQMTLSTTYKGININLSNSNQTAYQQFGYHMSVLCDTVLDSRAKVMFSVSLSLANPPALPGSHFVGIGTRSMFYQGNPYGAFPGNDGYSIGYASDGNMWYNGNIYSSGYSLLPFGDGDIIDICINNNTQGMWVRVNGGDWNNDPTQDPVANPSLAIEIINAPFYPVLCPGYEGTMTIQNTSSYGVPDGYTLLGTNGMASVGFNRSSDLTEVSFVSLVNSVFSQSFSTGDDAKTWLITNGYWTSWGSLASGMVLYLDANNTSSYPGSGTTWFDISGNNNDLDMQNSGSITWVDGGIGYFTTGSNGWFSKTSGVNMPIGDSLYTFSAWIQLGTSWNGQGIISVGPFGIGNQANALRTGSTNQFINYWWGNDFVAQNSLSPTAWFNIVARDNGTDRSIWINGVSIGTGPRGGHDVTTSDIQVAKTAGSEYLQGNIAQVLIYNTALSDSEILANFNTTKSRFGL